MKVNAGRSFHRNWGNQNVGERKDTVNSIPWAYEEQRCLSENG